MPVLRPDRVVRGLDETGPNVVYVWGPTTLGLNGAAYTAAGIKTSPIFASGLVIWSLFYTITGSGTTTVRAIAMDEVDSTELPAVLTLASGLAVGSGHVGFGGAPAIVVTSFELQFISTASSAITVRLFGRTS